LKDLTHTVQVGLFLQIIARAGPIPWPELTLPDGRTVKACQVMVDKEKQKIKKAREAAGEDISDLTTPKVRRYWI
jgi:antitoxin component of RelBE/YafQ-DinJ toxin-antitoxin module